VGVRDTKDEQVAMLLVQSHTVMLLLEYLMD